MARFLPVEVAAITAAAEEPDVGTTAVADERIYRSRRPEPQRGSGPPESPGCGAAAGAPPRQTLADAPRRGPKAGMLRGRASEKGKGGAAKAAGWWRFTAGDARIGPAHPTILSMAGGGVLTGSFPRRTVKVARPLHDPPGT